MKVSFEMIIERNHAASIGDAIIIPVLKMRIRLSPKDLLHIEHAGYTPFLDKLMLGILKIKDEDGAIPKMRTVDAVVKSYLDKKKVAKKRPHDLTFEISVDFVSKRGCHFCMKILPPLSKLTMLTEIVANSIVGINSLILTERFIPMPENTAKAVAMIQAISSTIFWTGVVFSGTGFAFMDDFASVIDEYSAKWWRKLTCRDTTRLEIESQTESKRCDSLAFKIGSLKGLFFLLALNNLVCGTLGNYQGMNSLSHALIDQDSWFPDWLIYWSSWVAYGANQFNNPIQQFNLVMLGFALISAYFDTSLLDVENNHFQESESSHWLNLQEAKMENRNVSESNFEDLEMNNIPLLTEEGAKGFKRFGLLSSNENSSNEPLLSNGLKIEPKRLG